MASNELGPNLQRCEDLTGVRHDWGRLLLSASVLAASAEGPCQAAALRIAHGCLLSSETSESRRAAAALLLDSLANRPAIQLALKRGLVRPGFEANLPLPTRIEWTRRAIENSIPAGDGAYLAVNRFQKKFWVAATSNEWVSVSAPTSAGKSFIDRKSTRLNSSHANISY